MAQKLSIKETMKPVIEALRDRKKTWGELAKLKIKSGNHEKKIPEKTLHRILTEYLEHWNLVRKEGNFWVWYEYSRVLTPHNFDLIMNHSKLLLQRFHTLVQNPDKYSQDEEYVAMKEHLEHSSEIYQKLGHYERAFTKMNRELMQNKEVLSKFFYDRPLDPFAFKEDLNKFKPTTPEEQKLKDALQKEFDRFWEIYIPLKSDLNSLETKFLHGQPLEGKCSLCPKVKIMEEGGKADKKGVEP